jgi:hypothetical protein
MAFKAKNFIVQNDPFAGLKDKRKERRVIETKYNTRKDRSPSDYKRLKVKVNGVEQEVSDSAKFFLDTMKESEGSVEVIEGGHSKTIGESSSFMLDMIIQQEEE